MKNMVFNKAWFEKHQQILLLFANTFIGRYVLRIHGKKSNIKGDILKIEPNAITWRGEKENEFFTEFRTHDKYAKRLYYGFKPFWYLAHFFDLSIANNFSERLNLGFDTLTAYPDANPETSSFDGVCYRSGVNETFSTIRNGAGVSAFENDTATDLDSCRIDASTTSNQYALMGRSFALFDTSSLGAGATISNVVLSLYGSLKANGLGAPNLHIAAGNPASNTSISSADYTSISRTSYGSVTYASFSTSAYNDITLDSNGISNVSKTGISKFSLQSNWDINNTTSGLSWSSAQTSYIRPFSADRTGISTDPKLVVTFIASDIKKVIGVEYASIKSIAGVVIADVKKVAGLA